MTDTIYALSSGAPPAAIAIIRISGAAAFAAVGVLAGDLPTARRASLRALRDPVSGALLDRALVIVFPASMSVTGEDLAELHLHGGRAVVRAVEAALGETAGLRPAAAGEFTRRALEAGRIDLTAAEGLADLLSAETEAQRRAALRSAEGQVRQQIEEWSLRAVGIAALLEAAIDHEDEDDVGHADMLLTNARTQASVLATDIDKVLARPAVERLRDGIRVVLAGPPNSGKSTLINALAGREVAIVSPVAGTTRDRIEAPVFRNGIAWVFTDTAGLTETTDPIEAIGVLRARESIVAADLVIWLGDDAAPHPDALLVHARADMPGRELVAYGRVAASGTRSDGTVALWAALDQRAAGLIPPEDVVTLNRRQARLANEAAAALRNLPDDVLLAAEQLRLSRGALDAVTGRGGVEPVLDALFSRFCIGK